MIKALLIMVVALFLEAVGVVLLKMGLKEIGQAPGWSFQEISRLLIAGATNKYLIAGIAVEAVFFGGLLYLLSSYDLTFIWPLTALGFIVTALFAKFLLKEDVSGLRWAGIVFIVIGAFLISWSEKSKERALKKQQAAIQQLQ